ncbi:MAG TPA: DUF2723 domain-containing protein [Anaerolineae bacterium]|nr:DUF2723 domain-containing protein [Anaerolineae bacterium]
MWRQARRRCLLSLIGARAFAVREFGALAVFGLSLLVYVMTLLPGVGWGDTAKLQYIAGVWGVPHRFGYPLFIFLSRIFLLLPVGSVAYRINLMCAVFAAATVALVYAIILRLTNRDRVAAVAGSLAFAFSRTFWAEANHAEVYSLNALIVAAVVLALLTWHQTRRIGYLYLGIALYATGYGNHMTMITWLPAVLFIVVATDWRVLVDPRRVVPMMGLALLGPMQYLYVILRSQQPSVHNEILNEIGTWSWRGWWHWMTYSRFEGQFFGYSLPEQIDLVRHYLDLLQKQFYRWSYVVGWIGAWEQLQGRFVAPAFLGLVGMGTAFFAMNYGRGRTNGLVYLIPAYLIFAILVGCGLAALRHQLAGLLEQRAHRVARPAGTLLAVAILALPGYPLVRNYQKVDRSHYVEPEAFARTFVENAEPEFILISGLQYNEPEAIFYMATIEIPKLTYHQFWQGEAVDQWFGVRPIYCWEIQQTSPRTPEERIPAEYILEPLPYLPGMARVVGKQTDDGVIWANPAEEATR